MERMVYFRDNQEQQAADHTNMQLFARQSFDHIVRDTITASPKYAGFQALKTSQVEVTVAPGRFFKSDGAVYSRATSLVQNLTSRLAAASKRIIVLAVSDAENDVDEQERDILIDADTGDTEPDTVPMTRSRDAVLSFYDGAESPDPQVPPIPAGYAAIAHILVDTLQIVSVTMQPGYEIETNEALDQRAGVLETDMAAVKPKVSSLDAQLAALANLIAALGDGDRVIELMQDMATVKETIGIPDDAASYAADHFLDEEESDVADAAGQGYDAEISEGIRFPAANEDLSEIGVFSANDPNAAISGGLLLPTYEHSLKLSIGPFHSDLAIGQFGFQTVDIVKRKMSRQRTRYGSPFKVSTSGRWWQSGKYNAEKGIFKRGGETFSVENFKKNRNNQKFVRLRDIHKDSYKVAYWDYIVTEHEAVGAHVSQTFPVATDFWLTKIGFWLAAKAADEAVHMVLSEVVNGQPDLATAILVQTIPHGDLVAGGWKRVTVTPTFLEAGKRYAVSLISNANHKLGMALGQTFVDGTFFTSTDGVFFQGDLTKDLLLELYGAKFAAPQVVIEFDALNLDGGMRAIDILADTIVPESTELVYEIQPGAAGEWRPLTEDDTAALSAAPPLCRFRARFVGSRDIMPGLMLTDSLVKISRPKTAFKHVSTTITLPAPSDDIYVRYILEEFDDTPHDLTPTLRHGASWVTSETPDAIVDRALPDLPEITGRVERTCRYQLAAPIDELLLIEVGATSSAGNTYHVADRTYWAL